ncbi:MAG: hypothetical protein ACO1N5_02695 [Noviherbaspirillum sp.]
MDVKNVSPRGPFALAEQYARLEKIAKNAEPERIAEGNPAEIQPAISLAAIGKRSHTEVTTANPVALAMSIEDGDDAGEGTSSSAEERLRSDSFFVADNSGEGDTDPIHEGVGSDTVTLAERIQPRISDVPVAGGSPAADGMSENRKTGLAALKEYFADKEGAAKGGKKSAAQQLAGTVFRDNGPQKFCAAFRDEAREFFAPMDKVIERSFTKALIRKGTPPLPGGNKQMSVAEQRQLDAAKAGFDYRPIARFGKKLSHALIPPLGAGERITARLKGESFSEKAARAAYDRFPEDAKAMLGDVAREISQVNGFRDLDSNGQEKILRDALTACLITYGANSKALASAKAKFPDAQDLQGQKVRAMTLAQTYLKAAFGLEHGAAQGERNIEKGNSGKIADLVSASERKRAIAFIDLVVKDAKKNAEAGARSGSLTLDLHSPDNAGKTNAFLEKAKMHAADLSPAAYVKSKIKDDFLRQDYVFRYADGREVECIAGSEKPNILAEEALWKFLNGNGLSDLNAFKNRTGFLGSQEMKNHLIERLMEENTLFMQHNGRKIVCPGLKVRTRFTYSRLENGDMRIRIDGDSEKTDANIRYADELSTFGSMKDVRLRFTAEVTVSNRMRVKDRIGPVTYTWERGEVEEGVFVTSSSLPSLPPSPRGESQPVDG